jgi:hypothetical protein
MANYDSIASFYDYFQGDGASRSDVYRSLITKHHPSAETLLELVKTW